MRFIVVGCWIQDPNIIGFVSAAAADSFMCFVINSWGILENFICLVLVSAFLLVFSLLFLCSECSCLGFLSIVLGTQSNVHGLLEDDFACCFNVYEKRMTFLFELLL